MATRTVGDIMSSPALTAGPSDTLAEADRLLPSPGMVESAGAAATPERMAATVQ